MIAGNDQCILINGHRYLGQSQLFCTFNDVIKEKYNINSDYLSDNSDMEISLGDVRDILDEVCERLYANMWNESKKVFNQEF